VSKTKLNASGQQLSRNGRQTIIIELLASSPPSAQFIFMVIEPLNSLFLQFCSKTSGTHPVSNSDRNGLPGFPSPPAKPYGKIFHLEAPGSFYHE
ncbi:7551_t:CDS:2, partial [Ambispora gerdemannii]